MSRWQRYLPRPGALIEITQRTFQGRYLLRPSPQLNLLVVGVLARAQQRTGLRIHGLAVLSNHFHLLASAATVEQVAKFMGYVKTNVSKEVGRLHDWPGPLFDRRYTMIPVSDEEDTQVQRLEYLLAQGCKEGLVASPLEWPGVHCAHALVSGKPVDGLWVDRTALWAARQRQAKACSEDFASRVELHLQALPCWRHLTRRTQRKRAREIIARIIESARQQSLATGKAPLGADFVLRQHPHRRSENLEKSRQPLFHARAKEVRQALSHAWSEFLRAYREAAERHRRRPVPEDFPENSFVGGARFIEPSPVQDSS